MDDRKQDDIDLEELAEPFPRSRWLGLSAIEKMGLLVLLVLIGLFLVRPVYVWNVKREAAALHREIESLSGSTNPNDWRRLHELTEIQLGQKVPGGLRWFVEASQDTVGAVTASVHASATKALENSILQDSEKVVTALTYSDPDIVSWAEQAILREHRSSERSGDDPDWIESLAKAWLGGDPRIWRYMQKGNAVRHRNRYLHQTDPLWAKAELIGQVITALNENLKNTDKEAVPQLEKLLERVIDPISRGARRAGVRRGGHMWLDLLHGYRQIHDTIEWYVVNVDEDDLERASLFVEELARLGVQAPEVYRTYFRRDKKDRAEIFRLGIANPRSPAFDAIVRSAFDAGLTKPHDAWTSVCTSTNKANRLMAARVLGHEKATEAADCLAGLLNGAKEICLQAAWSLATMGDPRGREVLERYAENNVDTCHDLPAYFEVITGQYLQVVGFVPYTAAGRGQVMSAGPAPSYRFGEVARNILRYIDAGGTIPLEITPWPTP